MSRYYECDGPRHHQVTTPDDYKQQKAGTACPALHRGSPCDGTLWRIGDGADAENGRAGVVSFKLSGSAMQVLRDGGFPADEPIIFAKLDKAPHTPKGKGVQYEVRLRREEAVEVREYLLSVAEVLECMTYEERGADGTREAKACRTAIERIDAALGAVTA